MPATSPSPPPANPAADAPGATATFAATAPAGTETAERLAVEDEVTASIAATREVGGLDLYPTYDDGTSAASVNLADPLPVPPPGDDTTFEDERPAPLGPEDAARAFVAALRELIEIPDLRDPADPSGNTVIVGVGDIQRRYPFRSRPWFSDMLSELASGGLTPPPALALSRAEDLGSGRYRLSRVPEETPGA